MMASMSASPVDAESLAGASVRSISLAASRIFFSDAIAYPRG
jgi:hypothetical protein